LLASCFRLRACFAASNPRQFSHLHANIGHRLDLEEFSTRERPRTISRLVAANASTTSPLPVLSPPSFFNWANCLMLSIGERTPAPSA